MTKSVIFPTLQQELLLKASLASGRIALDAWRDWHQRFRSHEQDHGTLRLSPLLIENLRQLGVVDQVPAQFKNAAKFSWFKNHILITRISPVLDRLRAAGIETLLLKGLPLALTVYPKLNLRPMGDVDIVVHPQDWHRAVAILTEAGWQADQPAESPWNSGHHAIPFRDRENCDIDLHHSPFHECLDPLVLAPFWQAALPVHVQGVESRMLCPADQLLHGLAHGLRWNYVSPIRWVADAVMILRAEPPVDWPRFVAQARHLMLGQVARAGLGYLETLLPGTVPAEALLALRSLPYSGFERLEWISRNRRRVLLPGIRLLGHDLRANAGKPLRTRLVLLCELLKARFRTKTVIEAIIRKFWGPSDQPTGRSRHTQNARPGPTG